MSLPPRQNQPKSDVFKCKIVFEPEEVAARLRELRIRPEAVREIRSAWARGEASVSPFGPKNGAGMESWLRAIETLREMQVMDAWTMIDRRGIAPYVQSPDGTLALTVASGDEGTGVRHLTPCTKNTKGIVVVEAVERNWQQLTLNFGQQYRREVAPRQRKLSAQTTMIMLMSTVRRQRTNEPMEIEYHAEISTPMAMSRRRISEWSERILLPIEYGDGCTPTIQRVPELLPDMGMAPEVNIQVPRKKGA